jgi:CRP-like cAMP-binding protein
MPKTCHSELLEQALVFGKLSDRERQDISRVAIPKHVQEGEFLALQGQVWPYVLYVREGLFRVQKVSQEGREFGTLRLSGGQVFWSPSLMDDGPLPASLEASEPSDVFLWHRDQILINLRRNPDALWELCGLLIQRMRKASEMVEELAFQPVASRLASLLIKEYQEQGGVLVGCSLTLDEMAAMIGTTPVMVCKILSRFADQGVIKVSRTEFEFIDWEAIEKNANPE